MGIGIVLAIARSLLAIVNIQNLLMQGGAGGSQDLSLVLTPVIPIVIVAWAYLLAVVVERRHRLLSLAAAATLLVSLMGILSQTVFASWYVSDQGDSLGLAVLTAIGLVVSITFVVAMLLGILRELPRGTPQPSLADSTAPREVPIAAR